MSNKHVFVVFDGCHFAKVCANEQTARAICDEMNAMFGKEIYHYVVTELVDEKDLGTVRIIQK